MGCVLFAGLVPLLTLPAASTTRWVKPRDVRAAHPTDLFLADGTAEAPRTNSCQTTFIPIANRTGGAIRHASLCQAPPPNGSWSCQLTITLSQAIIRDANPSMSFLLSISVTRIISIQNPFTTGRCLDRPDHIAS